MINNTYPMAGFRVDVPYFHTLHRFAAYLVKIGGFFPDAVT